eukprot:TRINITY_DN60960_c0_g1_i1.p1 TRINITY_DN60960_c0_g1~~TRINITY_DN60960_c0_g1_i1.p1  ORF type:complete len:1143 (-),score=354.31 TRINITY_DN60960_c0_g1_i1:9-3029(-)
MVPEAMPLAEAEALDAAVVRERLQAAVGKLLVGVNVLDFQEINTHLCSAIPLPNEAEAEEEDAEAQSQRRSLNQASLVLRALLGGELVQAAGRLMDCSAMEALKHGIVEFGDVSEDPEAEEEEYYVAPPIDCQTDLEVWQKQWPDLCFPVLRGSTARRRLFLGITCWASKLEEAQAVSNSAEWKEELIDEAAEIARLAALEEINPAEMDEDEAPDPEPHEYCPPLNCVTLATELGLSLASKAGSGGSLPAGEDFEAGVAQLRQMLVEHMPKYVAAEQKMIDLESGELEAKRAAVAQEKLKRLQEVGLGDESDEESIESDKPVAVMLIEEQQRSAVYFVLHLDADAAYDADAGTYCFAEGGEAKSQEELIDYYEQLCKQEPLLKCLVAPFSPRDPRIEEGLKALRKKLDKKVSLIDEAFDESAMQDEEEDDAPEELSADMVALLEESSEQALRRDGIGRVRDLRHAALGLVNQRIRLLKKQHGNHALATAELGRQGIYDLDDMQDMLPALAPLLDAAMAFPDSNRRLLMPAGSMPEDFGSITTPLTSMMCSLMQKAYGCKKSNAQRKKSKDLNRAQFREGLRRIGYQYADEYANLIFDWLDQSKNGSISPSELRMIELVNGPGTLQDLDELRLWLCEWKARRMAAAKEKSLAEQQEKKDRGELDEAEIEAAEKQAIEEKKVSPLMELWHYMDRDGSGEASFNEFRWALRKARHPAGVNSDKGPALELFMCLDIAVDGSIERGEFFCLSILSAYFQLQRVTRVRHFLEDRFGTLKAAFKFMDEDKGGSVTTQEWLDFMLGPQGYPEVEDIKVCFIFIDKDFSGQLTSKEFEFLGNFDEREFVADVKALRDHLLEKYENLSDAYIAFEQKLAPPDMGGIEVSQLSEKKRKRREGRGLSGQDFVNACKLCGFKGKFDSRLHFNFLDAAHVGHITRPEFMQLAKLGAVEALHASSERMRAAIATLKAFVFKEAELEAPEEPQANERWKWAAVHEVLRDATHDDVDLMEPTA